MPLGGSSKLLKALNEAAALGHLLDHGQLTRAELRTLTGLSKPTISEAVRRLADADLVVGAGHETGRPGPNAEVYAVNPDAAYAVAMSVRDGTPSLTASLHDLRGVQRARLALPVDFANTDPATAVGGTIDALCAAAGVGRGPVAHVQLAVAGAFDPRDRVIHHVDVPGWSRRGLVDDLATAAGVPVEVDNDVNLAALAERAHGAAQRLPDDDGFVLLWLGEGGLGLAIDLGGGKLLRGARGGAGEIGYMPVAADGARDFHDLVSGDAVRTLAAERGVPLTDSACCASWPGASCSASPRSSRCSTHPRRARRGDRPGRRRRARRGGREGDVAGGAAGDRDRREHRRGRRSPAGRRGRRAVRRAAGPAGHPAAAGRLATGPRTSADLAASTDVRALPHHDPPCKSRWSIRC
ncbi:ROK family transcriptional regulator [Dactylosporangium sp. NBC_01737]|uniref:ROK family transcriptional regulator n=1 Tax=Dactylosporangium sp. NBC_01737 TaxID=2975959 RepID=UPI002E0E9075|nr:ROK family transcriptional regulator [Dactylosporangium sp. NBC_01737]